MFLQRLGATDTATVAVEAHETDQPHSGGTTSKWSTARLLHFFKLIKKYNSSNNTNQVSQTLFNSTAVLLASNSF